MRSDTPLRHFWLLLLVVLFGSTASAASNQTLEGQLAGLAADIKDFLEGDRLLKNQNVRLDRVSSSGLPDANIDLFIEQEMTRLLGEIVDNKATLLLKLEYSYLVSETETNRDNRVIQIIGTLIEKGRPKKSFLREVNNTADIGRINGNTQAPPDSEDYQLRLVAAQKAAEEPQFGVKDKTQVLASGNANYSVEVRRRVGGKGAANPVVPVDQNGKAFASIDISDTYEIALFNYDTQADAVAKVDIDGLDALSTFCSDLDDKGNKLVPSGYFIPRATSAGPGVHVVPGWFHTIKTGNDNVFEFVVNALGQGAASALKVRGKTGIITVRFFDAYKPGEKPRERNFGETGKGQPRKQDYVLVESVIGSEPLSIVSVRYSRSPQ
jgi:hypothetical protein